MVHHNSVNSVENNVVDFVPRLPLELIAFIFRSFDTDELVNFTRVSNPWKRCIANCSSLWRVVSIADDECETLALLDEIGDHVRSYHISNACQEILDGNMEKLTCGRMNNLQVLSWYNCEFAHEHIIQPLQYLQHLTELIVTIDHEDWDQYEPSVPDLPIILGACPHLKRLNVNVTASDVFEPLDESEIDLPTNLQLTHLNWSNGSDIEEYTIIAVLMSCPKLQYLMIGQCYDADLLFIRNNCPATTWFLSINNDRHSQKSFLERQWTYDRNPDKPGLHVFGFGCDNDEDAWIDLVAVMQNDQHVLEKLIIQITRPIFRPFSLLNNFYGGQVTFLSCEYYQCDASLIVQLFRKCPNLRQAEIGANLELMDDDEDLVLPPNLKTLVLTNHFSDDEEDIEWLFNGIRRSTTLHTLKLREFEQEPPMYALFLLAILPHLVQLDFYFHHFSAQVLMDYVLSTQNPTLVSVPYIRFHGPRVINDAILFQLADATKLTKVAIHQCNAVTDHGVRHLVDNAAGLEKLDIVKCSSISQETLKYVNKILRRKAIMKAPISNFLSPDPIKIIP